jgi:hypothetical protein
LACHLQIDADPDPAYHFDPDPAYNFGPDPDPAYHLDLDPDPTFQFDADPDPQHFFQLKLVLSFGTDERSDINADRCSVIHSSCYFTMFFLIPVFKLASRWPAGDSRVHLPLSVPGDDGGVCPLPPQPHPGRHLQRPDRALGQPPQQADPRPAVPPLRQRTHAPRLLRQGRVGKNPGLKKKTARWFFGFFGLFWALFGFFGFFLYICPEERVFWVFFKEKSLYRYYFHKKLRIKKKITFLVGFLGGFFYCQPCAKVVGTQNAHNLITISTDGKAWEQLSCIIRPLFLHFCDTVFSIHCSVYM